MGRVRRRVVILGGGYAGIRALEALSGAEEVEVLLIDRNRYHFLQTESYSFIASQSTLYDITVSLEELAAGLEPNISFVRDEVIALEEDRVIGEEGSYPYDYLIIAVGSETNTPGLFQTEKLYGVKRLKNALRVKHRFEELMLRKMRGAEGSDGIVVIGGGSSGVEIAAEMQNTLNASSYFRGVSVTLVADLFLAELDDRSRQKARQVLEESGVKILDRAVRRVDERALYFDEGELEYDFGVLATGIAAGDLLRKLPFEKEGGFLKVDEYLRVSERIYAAGDAALLRDRSGSLLPPTAQTAEQSGTQAARNILRAVRGEPLKAADLRIYGLAIALGGKFAIAVSPLGRLDGILAHLGKKAIENFYKIPLRLKSANPDKTEGRG